MKRSSKSSKLPNTGTTLAVTTTEGAFISSRLTETIISGSRIPMASSMTMLETTLKLRELNAAKDVANGRISECRKKMVIDHIKRNMTFVRKFPLPTRLSLTTITLDPTPYPLRD